MYNNIDWTEHDGGKIFPRFSPDCLIFDVDGVLIDVRMSFPELIRAAVECEWSGAGFVSDEDGYSDGLNSVLKRHGSFNDDYDIAWILLNICAASGREKLSEALPLPGELEKIISSCGGDCVAWARASFPEKFGRGAIREACFRNYEGGGGMSGAYLAETPMLKAHWSALPLPAYVYTGRDKNEWRLAKKTLGWEDFPDARAVTIDSGMMKPSPDGILHICAAFGHKAPLFFGDTMSDRMALESSGRGRFVAIGGLPRAGAEYDNVERALSLLFGWRNGEL